MQSVLYALAMKVLTNDEIKKVKEMMTVTLLGQLLVEHGEFKNMQELIRDGLLSMKTDAVRKHMMVVEFHRYLNLLNLL